MRSLLSCIVYKLPHFACLLGITLASAASYADKIVVPDAIEGVTTIGAEELIELIEEYPELVVIDARMGDRQMGYLEGSISLPDVDTDCDSLGEAIPDKTTATAFYCNGIRCGRSVKSIRIAQQCGYQQLYWYRGGFEDWMSKNYPYVVN